MSWLVISINDPLSVKSLATAKREAAGKTFLLIYMFIDGFPI
jgi:hypothetical protein